MVHLTHSALPTGARYIHLAFPIPGPEARPYLTRLRERYGIVAATVAWLFCGFLMNWLHTIYLRRIIAITPDHQLSYTQLCERCIFYTRKILRKKTAAIEHRYQAVWQEFTRRTQGALDLEAAERVPSSSVYYVPMFVASQFFSLDQKFQPTKFIESLNHRCSLCSELFRNESPVRHQKSEALYGEHSFHTDCLLRLFKAHRTECPICKERVQEHQITLSPPPNDTQNSGYQEKLDELRETLQTVIPPTTALDAKSAMIKAGLDNRPETIQRLFKESQKLTGSAFDARTIRETLLTTAQNGCCAALLATLHLEHPFAIDDLLPAFERAVENGYFQIAWHLLRKLSQLRDGLTPQRRTELILNTYNNSSPLLKDSSKENSRLQRRWLIEHVLRSGPVKKKIELFMWHPESEKSIQKIINFQDILSEIGANVTPTLSD